QDILDTDLFWKEELLLATKDRLFGCGFDTLDTVRSGREEVAFCQLASAPRLCSYDLLYAAECLGPFPDSLQAAAIVRAPLPSRPLLTRSGSVPAMIVYAEHADVVASSFSL
ncbi:hypothetical protein C8J57DRAFT_1088926, partial [Mycena rebaudengoi]